MQEKQSPILFYGKPSCPQVPPVRGVLQRADVPFTYVDISRDHTARALVRDINDGYESVPTLVFPDGQTMTEPPLASLKKRLNELGYTVRRPAPWQSLRENPIYTLLGLAGLLFGALDGDPTLMIGGGMVLLFVVLWGYWQA